MSVVQSPKVGVLCISVGEKKKLVVRLALGYREEGAFGKNIPPGATLFFHLDLVDIEEAAASVLVIQQKPTF